MIEFLCKDILFFFCFRDFFLKGGFVVDVVVVIFFCNGVLIFYSMGVGGGMYFLFFEVIVFLFCIYLFIE